MLLGEPGAGVVDGRSQHHTAAATLALFECQQGRTGGSLEYIVNAFAAQTGAF